MTKYTMKPLTLVAAFLLLVFPASGSAKAQDELRSKLQELEKRIEEMEGRYAGGAKPPELDELRRQIDVLAVEVEKLRSGESEIEVTEQTAKSLGLGGSAVSVYRKRNGVSIAGYGEMVYENYARSNESGVPVRRTSQLDFLRAILYAGYRFNDKLVFNSEIEFEHASTGRSGEASVEFAYIDYIASPRLTLRGGLLLMPMGLTNEFHEPTAFIGVRRSETETLIIPSTWRENGLGIVGTSGPLQYRAYLVNGMDAAGFTADGIRGGRQKGARAKASDLAVVGRADVTPVPGILVGGSLYRGGSGQDQFVAQGRTLDVDTTVGELHAQIQIGGLDLRGLFARSTIGDAAELNSVRGLAGPASIGEVLQGGYAQLGYNILAGVKERTRLVPFYRFEQLNTQFEVPTGFSADPSRRRTFHTAGIQLHPAHGLVVKTDYQWIRNRARTGQNQFNIGLGYAF
jgi:hypothetical protein